MIRRDVLPELVETVLGEISDDRMALTPNFKYGFGLEPVEAMEQDDDGNVWDREGGGGIGEDDDDVLAVGVRLNSGTASVLILSSASLPRKSSGLSLGLFVVLSRLDDDEDGGL